MGSNNSMILGQAGGDQGVQSQPGGRHTPCRPGGSRSGLGAWHRHGCDAAGAQAGLPREADRPWLRPLCSGAPEPLLGVREWRAALSCAMLRPGCHTWGRGREFLEGHGTCAALSHVWSKKLCLRHGRE